MENEEWIRWDPLESVADTIYLDNLSDDDRGITLRFSSEDESTTITFVFGLVLSYRNTDEGNLIQSFFFIPGHPKKRKFLLSRSEAILVHRVLFCEL